MPTARSRIVAAGALLLAAAMAVAAQSSDPYQQAQDFEQHERYPEAAAAYREAIRLSPGSLPAILGLERVYAQLGWTDSMLPVLDSAIAVEPRSAALRAAQLRTLRTLGDRAKAREAFDRWRHDVPHDPQAYREYARMLIADGETAAADTVLRLAQSEVGTGRGFEYELAQLRAALGLWELSAQSWRQAVADNGYLDQAATFSLMPTPVEMRPGVRRTLAAPPAQASARRVLASLELAWGDARAGWDALRVLPPDTAAIASWLDFARRAEEANAWLPARDALVAVEAQHRSADIAARAAGDALRGGDAASAIALSTGAEARLDSGAAASAVLPVHVAALAEAARPADAERLLQSYQRFLSTEQKQYMQQVIARGWIRAGNLQRARALLAQAGDSASGEASGWLALFDGDLATARRRLKPTDRSPLEMLSAVALLGRTKADKSPAAGAAFLALVRGDSARAGEEFEAAATQLPEAEPLLLSLAARLETTHGNATHAMMLWRKVVERSPESPEAPEADLEWARALRRLGDAPNAVDRLEHLILTYPQSALVPQARRELDLARQAVPSATP